MIERRPFNELGGEDHGWLKAKHHRERDSTRVTRFELVADVDLKSRSCCCVADVVKTKFKVESGDEKYPEDRRYAWINDQ